MAGEPIRLGSALGTRLIFEAGSRVTTDSNGIQSCAVRAIYGDGENIFNVLPIAGQSYGSVFGNSYLPSDFLVDTTGGGIDIEYLEGRSARVTINFKRPDPDQVGVRTIAVDSVINYKSIFGWFFYTGILASGASTDGLFGFPEPVVSVMYNLDTLPSIGAGDLTALYALPGSTKAQGFPAVPIVEIPYTVTLPAGSSVTYYDGTAFVTIGPVTVTTTFNFVIHFQANVLGWQLIRLGSDPVADETFWAVTETWRNYYYFLDVTLVSRFP